MCLTRMVTLNFNLDAEIYPPHSNMDKCCDNYTVLLDFDGKVIIYVHRRFARSVSRRMQDSEPIPIFQSSGVQAPRIP